MPTGSDLLSLARRHIGEAYVNTQVPKDNPDWKGPWDCAEFMSWLVYQVCGRLYGITAETKGDPRTADAYTGAWRDDAERVGRKIPVAQAAATVGAFLLRYPPTPGAMGHIALSDGRGGTVEAMGRAYGVRAGRVDGRRWDTGVLPPGIDYGPDAAPVALAGPAIVLAVGGSGHDPGLVRAIQGALAAAGLDPGAVDGDYGTRTAEAVAAFQEREGLVVDGEVGPDTARRLGVALAAPAPAPEAAVVAAPVARSIPAGGPAGGVGGIGPGGSMGPLIAIAAAVLPEILKALAANRDGTVAGSVAKAVTEAAGTADPTAAQQRIRSDPSAAMALQVRLAEIALDQERARQQAQAEAARAQAEAQARAVQADLDNTRDARDRLGAPSIKGALFVTYSVVGGFFAFLLVLMAAAKTGFVGNDVLQMLNIAVGALTAAFATVVNFWLGSSQTSRDKDVTNAKLQDRQTDLQAKQTEIIRSQADQVVQATLQQPPGGTVTPLTPRAAPAKRSNFQRCMDFVLLREGGYSNDPRDKGGPTQFGITLATLQNWRGPEPVLSASDVANLKKEEACEIYRTRFWNLLRCDDLPAGVDLLVFDFGVNAGPGRSARLLQKAVGANPDGSVGPATIAAVAVADPAAVIRALSQAKLDYYKGLDDWKTFGNGWTNRVHAIENEASAMVGPQRAAA